MSEPIVAILMGSESDLEVMKKAAEVLAAFDVPHELRISSAHRMPEETFQYARSARERGLRVLIAGAGMAAHLPGVVAAAATLPVVGVPLSNSPLKGSDALHAVVQMPPESQSRRSPSTAPGTPPIWPSRSSRSGTTRWPGG